MCNKCNRVPCCCKTVSRIGKQGLRGPAGKNGKDGDQGPAGPQGPNNNGTYNPVNDTHFYDSEGITLNSGNPEQIDGSAITITADGKYIVLFSGFAELLTNGSDSNIGVACGMTKNGVLVDPNYVSHISHQQLPVVTAVIEGTLSYHVPIDLVIGDVVSTKYALTESTGAGVANIQLRRLSLFKIAD